jgi:hypothetical protein
MPSVLGEMLHLNLWMKGYEGREIFTVQAPYSRAISKESVPEELYQKLLPTLVVRQKGEARTKPFVAIMDAFNNSEGESVTKVDYFAPRNENPGFVGIEVHSVGNRSDLIFNDESAGTENLFEQGVFNGSFGVVSTIGQAFHSMLLSNGTVFRHENISIEVPDKPGDVFIRQTQKEFEMDAPQPFTLTIAIDEKDKGELEVVGQHDTKVFKGKVVQRDNKRWVTFELPALHRIDFKLL